MVNHVQPQNAFNKMKNNSLCNAYKTVVENQVTPMVDEDEEGRANILREIANGLKDILEKIEKHTAQPSRLRSSVKTLRIPDEPGETSWMP